VGQGKVGDTLLRYGASCMQGWRLENEDAHLAQIGIEGKQIAMFGVYDGHAGKLTAVHAAQTLPKFVAMQDGFLNGEPTGLAQAMAQAYIEVDEDLMQLPSVKESGDRSGCTAISVCITPSHYVVANAGDSRLILVKGGAVAFASKDHKPDNPEEMKRIFAAGGTVFASRVNGDLSVSRALGDFLYKSVSGLGPAEQPITCVPEVTIIQREDSLDQFLLIACDGIWDVVSNETAASFIQEKMTIGYGLGRCCELLLDHCLELGSRDNMTVVIVTLPAAPKQIGTYREPNPPIKKGVSSGSPATGAAAAGGANNSAEMP